MKVSKIKTERDSVLINSKLNRRRDTERGLKKILKKSPSSNAIKFPSE
jgi:hypothetical protein